MYINISNIQNGEFVPLNPVIDNRDGDHEVSLAEVLYYGKWTNISEALKNNKFRYGAQVYTIADGYYDICALNKHYFAPLKLELAVNLATGLVSVSGITKEFVIGLVGPILGFDKDLPAVDPTKTSVITATRLPNLILYKELYIHFDEGLASGANIVNGLPSTLLRSIPVGQELCNSGKTVASLVKRQWRKLAFGSLGGIKLSVRDEKTRLMPFVYLSFVIEIRQKKKR